jgi:hypothetical protein
MSAPPTTLVPARGQVLWNGTPVTVGAVMTINDADPFSGAVGAFDSEGRFELMTNGQPGALIGQHKVRVASFGPGVSPPPLVPAQYAYFESTPLTMEVSRDASKNNFLFTIEGEAPESQRPAGLPDTALDNSTEPESNAAQPPQRQE